MWQQLIGTAMGTNVAVIYIYIYIYVVKRFDIYIYI